MTDLTNPYTEQGLQDIIARKPTLYDPVIKMARQLLATMQREAKLLAKIEQLEDEITEIVNQQD